MKVNSEPDKYNFYKVCQLCTFIAYKVSVNENRFKIPEIARDTKEASRKFKTWCMFTGDYLINILFIQCQVVYLYLGSYTFLSFGIMNYLLFTFDNRVPYMR